MKCVIVLPSIVPEFTQACLATVHPSLIPPSELPTPPTRPQETVTHIVNGTQWKEGRPELRLAVVYNTPEHNLGVAGSWNVGRAETLRTSADWLVVLSAAVRFGPRGGRDFLGVLSPASAKSSLIPVVEAGNGLGWHLIAFHNSLLRKIGPFDPIYSPAYFEDNDYMVRIQRAYDRDTKAPGFVGPLWPKVETDATMVEIAHGIKRSGVHIDMEGLKAKFVEKWGPDEAFRTPYNDPSLDWTYVGAPPLSVLAW